MRNDVSKAELASMFDNNTSRDGWLNPIAMSTLKRAVDAKLAHVSLNGREFKITYGEFFDYPKTGREECVKLTRTDGGSVPFGWVMLKTLREFKME